MNKKARNYLRFGSYGDHIYDDKADKKIIRVSRGVNTLPFCALVEHGKIINYLADFEDACDFLGI